MEHNWDEVGRQLTLLGGDRYTTIELRCRDCGTVQFVTGAGYHERQLANAG